MFIGMVVLMYILSRINLDKFAELFVIQSLSFKHVFPWRFITYCFYFADSPFFFFFTVLVLFLFAVNLERIWGSFYFGMFLLVTIVSKSIGSFLFGTTLPIMDRMALYTSLMIAFGFNFPEEKLYLFFVLPIKIKVLAIIALVIMCINLLNSLFSPLSLMFLESHLNMFPPEYATLLEDYYTTTINTFNYGVIKISPMFGPFLVNLVSYLNLLLFFPHVFGLSNNKIALIRQFKEKQQELLKKLHEQAIINQNKAFQAEQKPAPTQNDETVLCSEEDFDSEDEYCLKCTGYRKCLQRAGIVTPPQTETKNELQNNAEAEL